MERQSRDAFRGVLTGISRVQALKQALSSSEPAARATQAGYSVGTRTAVDVVNSERDLLRARRDYSQTRYDYVLNACALSTPWGPFAGGFSDGKQLVETPPQGRRRSCFRC